MNSFRIKNARVEIWRDLSEINERAAELLIGIARESVNSRGAFTIALAGGSTPKGLYRLLAQEEKSSRISWAQTHVYWTDERCVPPEDAQSNYRMAHDTLLSNVNVPAKQIHRMRGEDEPKFAAEAYAVDLEKQFGGGDPRFSLVLLGMGDDGHIASLFPASPALTDMSHTVAANFVKKLNANRLTLTLRTLNAAATTIFLVSGDAKAAALSSVFDKNTGDIGLLPARLVRPTNGELIWLVDEPAAELIDSRY